MDTPNANSLTTAAELFAMPSGQRCELVNGELRMMSPAGGQHGIIAGRLHTLLGYHVMQNHLGEVTTAETGFLIGVSPDTVRAPDIGFIRSAPGEALGIPKEYIRRPPNLAVEVVSPSDKPRDVEEKAQMWLDAGCEAVWIVWPNESRISVHDQQGVKGFTGEDSLTSSVVPGFSIKVADLFAGLQ